MAWHSSYKGFSHFFSNANILSTLALFNGLWKYPYIMDVPVPVYGPLNCKRRKQYKSPNRQYKLESF